MAGWARVEPEGRPELRMELRLLSTWAERLRGLLGTGPDEGAVMLLRCGSVHTFGMTYPLDVALVGERGEVLLVRREVPPCEVVSHRRAFCAIERPAREGEWVEEGDCLWVSAVGAGTTGT